MKRSLASPFVLFAVVVLQLHSVFGYPDGAPGESCKKHRPNHGATSQPFTTLPYIVQASGSEYSKGETIAVRIKGKEGIYFKGFFVQALDDKGRWVGEFEETQFSVSHPECSMTTHHDNEDKEEVLLVWHPPSKSTSGSVRFLVTILKNYKVYWVDIPAIAAKTKTLQVAEEEEEETQDAAISVTAAAPDTKREKQEPETEEDDERDAEEQEEEN